MPTSSSTVTAWCDLTEAPTKRLVWFENSAHTPQFEEPDKSRDLLMRARADQLTST